MRSGNPAVYEGSLFAQGAYASDSYFYLYRREEPQGCCPCCGSHSFAAEQLGHFPRIGHPGMSPHTYERAVRGLPYIIVYEIHSAPDVVVILGIFHGAQDRPI